MPCGALRTLALLLYLCTFSPPPEEGGIYSNQMNLRLMGGPSKEGTPRYLELQGGSGRLMSVVLERMRLSIIHLWQQCQSESARTG